MKKHHSAVLFLGAILASGCTHDKASDGQQPGTDTLAAADTVAADTVTAAVNIPFKVKNFEKKRGNNELEIDYPISGNPELVDSVRVWMSQQLTGTYDGNLADADTFFRHYSAQLGEDPDLNEYGGFTQDEFDLEYVNDYIVTYAYTSYIYEGGAHGMGGTYGTTFLQSDGQIFSKDCFSSYRALQPLFVEGLKRYFKVTTDEELLNCLLGVSSLSRLSPPGMNPWVEEEGVVFSYTPYEIAPYSAGSPRFTIPLAKIEPYLTPRGRLFFGL